MKRLLKYFLLSLFIILSVYLSLNIKIDSISANEKFPFNGIINADALVVYPSPNTGVAKSTELAYGSRITVLEAATNQKSGGCALYKISYTGGYTGYVCSKYIINVDSNTLTTDVKGIETYRAYCDALKSKGFIESYCPYLYYLHSKHPKWVFNAKVINYNLMEVANKEENKCVLDTSNSNYWLSSNPIESKYYYVNDRTISSFMDPRNSLFEGPIFQFLDIASSKDISNDASLAAIAGSGHLSKFYNDYKTSASRNGVNALHLMSRSKQEGANDSTYASVSGKYTTNTSRKSLAGYSLDGYYNFYNINTYADANYKYTVQRGLSWASGFMESNNCVSFDQSGKAYYDTKKCPALSFQRPWNSPSTAISGGAEFIASTYINVGQNTNYFQKFNVAPNNAGNMFTHQYMTNIHAPMSEGGIISDAYRKGNLFDSNFNFIIPVYKDMDASPYQAVDKSSNNKLSNLKVDGKTITGFDPDVTEYNYNAITGNSYVTIEGTASHGAAKVSGNGRANFSNGVVKVTVTVTAENGQAKAYVITIRQVVPQSNIKVSDILSKMAVKVSGDSIYGVSPDTAVSTIINTVINNRGNASVMDKNGEVKATGTIVTGDRILIRGTSDEKTLVFAVRGDINGDGKVNIVDLLLVQKDILGRGSLTGSSRLAGDVNYDGKLSIVDILLIQKHILGKGNL